MLWNCREPDVGNFWNLNGAKFVETSCSIFKVGKLTVVWYVKKFLKTDGIRMWLTRKSNVRVTSAEPYSNLTGRDLHIATLLHSFPGKLGTRASISVTSPNMKSALDLRTLAE